jgi:hypothetical protein
MEITLMFVLGLLLRIAIPAGLTVLLVSWLRRLDANWQAEAEQEVNASGVMRIGNRGCWRIMGCSEEKRAGCKAYSHAELPCWQVYRNGDGELREQCLGCKVFREAPAPVAA